MTDKELIQKEFLKEEVMTPLEKIKSMIIIQKDCLSENYMVGLHNGLELARAVLEEDDPVYEDTFSTPKGKSVDKEDINVLRVI